MNEEKDNKESKSEDLLTEFEINLLPGAQDRYERLLERWSFAAYPYLCIACEILYDYRLHQTKDETVRSNPKYQEWNSNFQDYIAVTQTGLTILEKQIVDEIVDELIEECEKCDPFDADRITALSELDMLDYRINQKFMFLRAKYYKKENKNAA